MKITPNKIILTAGLFLAMLCGYVLWAQTRCQSILTSTGLPCPRASTHKDGWCDVHQPAQKAEIDRMIKELVARGKQQ